MTRRNTVQKDIILKAVRELHGHVTADEVYAVLTREYPSIGRGTVYRNLAVLAEEGRIRHVGVTDGADCYDFTLKDHYHVQCVRCGAVFDVDMDVIPNVMDRIRDDHGFSFLSYDILFKGICPGCGNRQ